MVNGCFLHYHQCPPECTVDPTTAEDNRHLKDILNQMLLKKHPELKDWWWFAPEVKSSNCNGLFQCQKDTHMWMQIHNSVVEDVLRKAYTDVPGLTLEDHKHIQTRRGILDLRYEFAGSVIDTEFEAKLDINLDLFAVRNGVYDMAAGRFRATKPDDFVKTFADWKYSREESSKHRGELDKFMSEIFPVEEERKVFLTYVAGLRCGKRFVKKMLVLPINGMATTGRARWWPCSRHSSGHFPSAATSC